MIRAAWPHLRALLVVLHVTAVVLAALPAPDGAMNRKLWSEPTVRVEFEAWARRFGVTVDEFQGALWRVATVWMDARGVYMRPVRPYLDATGATQAWRMFAGANRFPTKFHVRVRDEGEPEDAWRSVYERDHPERRWAASVFEQERFRNGLDRFGWPHYRVHFEEACTWVARRALEAFPKAAAVQCAIWRERAPSPEQAKRGEKIDGHWWAEVTRTREELGR